MTSEKQILLVEDDSEIADLVSMHLRDLGHHLDAVPNGHLGLEKAEQGSYDLIILDLMLPGLDGLEVCKSLRAHDSKTPILMLTARSEEFDKVLGLELGADDYLTKPFSIRELLARVKALLRRGQLQSKSPSGTAGGAKTIERGPLFIDLEKRKVLLNGKPLELTVKEYDLLVLFAGNPGRAYSRSELLDTVWGYQFEGYDHTVNTHINRLRTKIEKDPGNPRFIKTVWGHGYRFAELEELS